MSVSSKRILVTGVASGIGRAVADHLVRQGAIVVGLDRNTPNARTEFAEFHRVDLSDPGEIDKTIERIEGRFDGIANVAGASSAAPVAIQFRVNFLGTRYLTERLHPRLNHEASVVNVAAGAGLFWRERLHLLSELLATRGFADGLSWLASFPQDERYSYARSKEALIYWTLKTAVDWIGSGRRINAVSPGPVETPMLDEFRSVIGRDVIAADTKRTGRAATAEDIAPIVSFLLSAVAWMNGANVAADGGFSASALTSQEPWPY